MKLISLELKNYTRLYVSGIKHIVYTPKTSFNTILGRNGSGKSSLVKEMFPNVDELKNDYDKGGYKILRLEHKEVIYTISYKRDNNSHSFLVDGKELNQQHIQKTQRMLIEQYFGLSKPIYEMMLSTLNFTSMSVSERKRWFTNVLTTIDYKYALDLYNKTKLRVKELSSFMKLVQSKLMKNSDIMKDLNPEAIALLKSHREIFHNMLDNILEEKLPTKSVMKPDMERLERESNLLIKYSDTLEKGKQVEDYNNEIVSIKERVKTLKDVNDDINVKLIKIDDLKIDVGVSLKELEDNRDELYKKRDSLLSFYKTRDIDTLTGSISNFNSNYNTLLTLSEELTSTGDIQHTDKDKLLLEIDSLGTTLLNLNSKIVELDKQFNLQRSYKEQPEVTCTKCNNIFKPNYDNDKYTKIKDELDMLLDKKETIKISYDEKKDTLDSFNKYTATLHNLKQRIENCCPFLLNKLDMDSLSSITGELSSLIVTLPKVNELETLKRDITEIENKISIYNKLSTEKRSYIQERRNELMKERGNNLEEIKALTTRYSIVVKKLKELNHVLGLVESVRGIMRDVKLYTDNRIESEYNIYLNKIILDIKREVSDIDGKLIEFDRLHQNNVELEKELKEYETKLDAVKKLEVMLSPNKGLIGESINSTMNIILDRMNEIISKVWSYDIVIQPCDISESDLTFRFPVKINNVKDIPDISKGSSSIKDIIDLAFKITAMEFLDMLDYPLILDELGSTFSSSHRVSVYDFIDELSKGYFNQIFMISHFEEFIGRHNNIDVVVLDNEGINYTGTHNKVIQIK